jgi:hypothetical protein
MNGGVFSRIRTGALERWFDSESKPVGHQDRKGFEILIADRRGNNGVEPESVFRRGACADNYH